MKQINLKNISFLITLFFVSFLVIFDQNVFIETANKELDTERINVQTVPTDANNLKHGRNMLERFSGMISFAGDDISGYAVYNLVITHANGDVVYKAVDNADNGMEDVYRTFKNMPEGQLFQPRENYYGADYKEWQLFHGNYLLFGCQYR